MCIGTFILVNAIKAGWSWPGLPSVAGARRERGNDQEMRVILLLIVTYYAPPGNTLQHVNTRKIERYTILLKIVIMEEYFFDKNVFFIKL